MIHNIKIKMPYYERILRGEKCFEIRFNDRDYQNGDTLVMNPVDSNSDPVTDEIPLHARIKYIHAGFGMADGYVVLGLENITIG